MKIEEEFIGKNVIITGASRGIGWAALERFASEGANIWACARKQDSDFEKRLVQLSNSYKNWIEPVYFDLADEQQVKNGIKQILKEKKHIDVLVNDAAVAYGNLLLMTPVNKLKEVFEVNYFMQILIIQMIAKSMIKQKQGAIINIASVGGIETNPGYLAYGSSKAALIWATQSIAKELALYNIRVNAVAPGLTDTGMGHYKSDEELKKVIERTAIKRMAKPSEIADAIVYLASERASYITGQILRVDGGR